MQATFLTMNKFNNIPVFRNEIKNTWTYLGGYPRLYCDYDEKKNMRTS